MKEFEQINLSEWKQIGRSINGIVFLSLKMQNVMMKLDLWGRKDKMRHEFEYARKATMMGIHTPQVFRLVTDGKRYGYTCRFICGKKSYCHIMADEPSRFKGLARRFAENAKSLHSKQCDTTFYPSRLEQSIDLLKKVKYLPTDMRERIIFQITTIPDRTTCLHGSLHFRNIITAESGDWWINMGRLAYGNPLYDFSQFYFMLFYMPGFICRLIFHVSKAQGQAFFRKAIDCYYHPQSKARYNAIYYQMELQVNQYMACMMKNPLLAMIYLPKLRRRLRINASGSRKIRIFRIPPMLSEYRRPTKKRKSPHVQPESPK